MTTHDPDHDVRSALRDLPPMTAPPGFTEGVLQRLPEGDARATSRGSTPRLAWAAVALTVLLGAGLGLWLGGTARPGDTPTAAPPTAAEPPASDPGSTLAQLEAFRREHDRLQRDLESLRELTRPDSPYVYLGGDEQVDFVWGLDEPAAPGSIQPVGASF